MDKDIFDYIEEGEEAPDRSDLIWNIATIVVLVMILCVGILFLSVLANPNAGINPFPPPTMPVTIALDTLTPTPKQVLPPTWTPTPTITLTPTETFTPEPTITPEPTTEVPADEAADAADAADAEAADAAAVSPADSDMPFVLHEGNPQYIPNLYHSELGCDWMGVGGQVLSLNGAPVTGVVLRLGGQLAGQTVDLVTVSGIATKYGPAGYEFDLTELVTGPTASSHSMWIQLLDQAGLAMSDQIYFDTYEECEKSTIIIYFKQVK